MSNNKNDELAEQQAKEMMKQIELQKNVKDLMDKYLKSQSEIQRLIEQNRRSYAELLQQMRINDTFQDYLDFYKRFESKLNLKTKLQKVYHDAKQTMVNMTKNTASVFGLGLGLGASKIARVLVDNVLPGITKAGYQIFSSMSEKDTEMDEKYELLQQSIKHIETQAKTLERFSKFMMENSKNTEKIQKEKLQNFVLKHIKGKLNDPAYMRNTTPAKKEALEKLLREMQKTSTDKQFELIQEFLKNYQLDDYADINNLTKDYDIENRQFEAILNEPVLKILKLIPTMLKEVPQLKEFSQEHHIRCKRYLLEEMEKIQKTIMTNIDIEIQYQDTPDNKIRLQKLKKDVVEPGMIDAINNLVAGELIRQRKLKKQRRKSESTGTDNNVISNKVINKNKQENKLTKQINKTNEKFKRDDKTRKLRNAIRERYQKKKEEEEREDEYIEQLLSLRA